MSTHGDARSCRMAKKLAAVHGHARLDWVLLLDPVATDVLACWQALAAGPKPSGLVGTAAAAAIRTPAADHRNMAGV